MRPEYQLLSHIAEELGCQPAEMVRIWCDPIQTVATSVYKFGTETIQTKIES